MQYGFIKAMSASPDIRIADCEYNASAIEKYMDIATEKNVSIVVFPELCITGATCGDLYRQTTLVQSALRALLRLARYSSGKDIITVVGLPIYHSNSLYNCSAVVFNGKIIGITPKSIHSGMHENIFSQFTGGLEYIIIDGYETPFSNTILYKIRDMENCGIAVHTGCDAWYAASSAHIVANPGAFNITCNDYTPEYLLKSQSYINNCAYIHANAGRGESTTDMVFLPKNFIAELGEIFNDNGAKDNYSILDIDLNAINHAKGLRGNTTNAAHEHSVFIDMSMRETPLTRHFIKTPFIPDEDDTSYAHKILNLQAEGLLKRMRHINTNKTVIAVSGGLDATLALLAAVTACDISGGERSDISAVSMPCFGTSTRTRANARELCTALGVSFSEIDITNSVLAHFSDIRHDAQNHNVVFENAQARRRTHIIMDFANAAGGLALGTGDLSEAALGWSTYNGDHMAMYNLNASIPKTLVRHIVKKYAESCEDERLSAVLTDILSTPISPELLPPNSGDISQLTESIIGPYKLHDFFIYHMMLRGYRPKTILKAAEKAFAGEYDKSTIKKWLRFFYMRFFSQQFKRSCSPDGPMVTGVSLSPRGMLRMPSDAAAVQWIDELNAED